MVTDIVRRVLRLHLLLAVDVDQRVPSLHSWHRLLREEVRLLLLLSVLIVG